MNARLLSILQTFRSLVIPIVWLFLFLPDSLVAQPPDTLTPIQFVTGCSTYRGLVIDRIINTLVDFNLLCDSMRDASAFPEAHEQFRKELMNKMLTIEGWDPEHIVSTSMPSQISSEKGVERRYKQWAYQNRVQMFEFTFLFNMGVIEEESPYRLGDLREFYKEISLYNLQAGQTLVDVGAGSGVVSYILRLTGLPLTIYMTEIDQQFLVFHQQQMQKAPFDQPDKEINLVVAGAKSLGLASDLQADRILMREVYHHLSRPAEVLEDVHNHLKPGGLLILVESVDELNQNREDHCNKGMKLGQIKEQLKAGGFDLVLQEQVGLSYLLSYRSGRAN